MGFATELAKVLIENASNLETVLSIQANTLGNLNSSVIVLLSCGFEKIDETDGKELRKSVKFYAHDEDSKAKEGDRVSITETRPLSKLKRWRLVEVLEAAKV